VKGGAGVLPAVVPAGLKGNLASLLS
jgi:hypothetical protein